MLDVVSWIRSRATDTTIDGSEGIGIVLGQLSS